MELNRHALTALREAKGISKADLARAIGVDRTYVSRWETGDRVANERYIRLMAETLGVSPLALTGALPAAA